MIGALRIDHIRAIYPNVQVRRYMYECNLSKCHKSYLNAQVGKTYILWLVNELLNLLSPFTALFAMIPSQVRGYARNNFVITSGQIVLYLFRIITSYVVGFVGPIRSLSVINSIDNKQKHSLRQRSLFPNYRDTI